MNAQFDDSARPFVSVLMPVCNGEPYVSEAIDSILAQTYDEFELLVLDDGSTDRSPEILRSYEVRDRRVRVITRENRGIVPSLNEMIALSGGEYIARMDADDISHPTRFEKQVAYLAAHPECVAVGTNAMLIDPEGWPIAEYVTNFTHEKIDAAHLLGRGGSICHPSVMMRKSVLERVGGYNEEFPHAQDLDLFLRLAEVGRLANLTEVLLDYRRHFGTAGVRRLGLQFQLATRAVQNARHRRGLEPLLAREMPRPISRTDLHRVVGWRALGAGYVRTARKHAWQALSRAPFSLENWRLAACVLRGH